MLRQTPALLLAGGKDAIVSSAAIQNFWKSGRATGAPWTFAIDPDAIHETKESLQNAIGVTIPCIDAVLRQRLSPDANTLRAVTDGSAWLGNIQTGEASLSTAFAGSKPAASWLPDESTARAWKIVLGAAK